MKSKPLVHKNENTFRFESFNERLSRISISHLRHLERRVSVPAADRRAEEEEEEGSCHFSRTLRKWVDLNCTDDFEVLKRAIGSLLSIETLPQLLFRRSELVLVLKNNLAQKENKAHEVTLELVAALARDLQQDFYPEFLSVFDLLVDLVNTQEVELIENVFMCLAYLFKTLWRYIANDFEDVFSKFASRLLGDDRRDYIRIFAAESFAFLMRKVIKRSSLIDFLFELVDKDPSLASGVGHLFFEVVKGVQKQLHSCCHPFLTGLLGKYTESRWKDSENVTLALERCFTGITSFVGREHSDVLWQILVESTFKAFDKVSENENSPRKVGSLLKFSLETRKSQLVKDPNQICTFLTQVLNQASCDSRNAEPFLDSTSVLLLNHFQHISTHNIRMLISAIFQGEKLSHELILNFCEILFDYPMFERDVLPKILLFYNFHILSLSNDSKLLASFLKTLVNLLQHKCPQLKSLDNLSSSAIYPLAFPVNEDPRKRKQSMSHLLLSAIEEAETNDVAWCALLCLPHTRLLPDRNMCCERIMRLVLKVTERLGLNLSEQEEKELSAVFNQAVVTLIELEDTQVFKGITIETMVDLIRHHPSNVAILQGFYFYLEFGKRNQYQDAMDLKYLETIYSLLEKNLSLASHSVRLLTLRILNLYNPPLPPTEGEIQSSIFEICLEAEKIPITVQAYREKLKFLSQLEYGLVGRRLPIEGVDGTNYDLMPLRYLLGTLFLNFTLMWEPIENLVESYARGYKKATVVWEVLLNHFQETEQNITKASHQNVEQAQDQEVDYPMKKLFDDCIADIFSTKDDRPDYVIHRLNLLNMFKLFVTAFEPRNRDVVQLFLDFMNREVYPSHLEAEKSTEDISKKVEEEAGEKSMEDSAVRELQDELEDEPKVNRRMTWKTVVAFLEVFSKFRNPKALYKEPEMKHIYLNLLRNSDLTVQEAAFHCIAAYNYPYLSPYKPNFIRLLDNKTFKSEIVTFTLNVNHEEDKVIQDNHRKSLLPILMRVLYGKMLSKTGPQSTGKSKSSLRRSIVLRFLAGCGEDELKIFLDLAFSSLLSLTSEEYPQMLSAIGSIEVNRCIPIRRVFSSLRTLETIIHVLGSISRNLLPYLFKTLIAVSSFTSSMLKKRDSIKPSATSQLKAVRTECFNIAIKFFQSFDYYAYSRQEVDALYEALIWPMLANLDNESLSSPSPMLRLFSCWSQNSRYFILLAKKDVDHNLFPLDAIINLYRHPKVNKTVVAFISEIIENLLTFDTYDPMEVDEDGQQGIPAIEVGTTQAIRDVGQKASLGTRMLLPVVTVIINRFKANFEAGVKLKGNKMKVKSQELSILSRISGFVESEAECGLLAKLLIETFKRSQIKSPEKAENLLKTIGCLLNQVRENIDSFLPLLAPLFSSVHEKTLRAELCNIMQTIASKDCKLKPIADIVIKLNSYSVRCLDEPDYNLRFEAVQMSTKTIDAMKQVDVHFLTMVVYNCCYFLRSIEDLGLKDAASRTLQKVVERLVAIDDKENFNRICIDILLLKEIRKGLKEKSEGVRHEFISVLTTLIKCGKDKHNYLTQLSLLCDEEDLEVDFWLNIRHIQLHRRARALNRFSKNREIISQLSSDVLSSFVLPLPCSFLLDQRYAKSNLLPAAIEAIGTISRFINWSRYEDLLKYYLALLVKERDFHNVIVKTISCILTNFNFDLTNCKDHSFERAKKAVKGEKKEEAKEEIPDEDEVLEDMEQEDVEEVAVHAYDGKQSLSEESATKVYNAIVKKMLPSLRKCLYEMSHADYEFDSMKSEHPEDEQIQRIPIALAMVKLLQTIPPKFNVLEANVPGIFMRMCHFLRSRAQSIRESSRGALVKIMLSLGSKYFPYLLKEMSTTLIKGYQLHILTYTVHTILVNMKPSIEPGGLDNCIDLLVEISNREILSDVADEKEVGKIVGKLREAKKTKSYETYYLLGCLVSESCLSQLFLPLREVLAETHSYKTVKKVASCFQKITLGLSENMGISEQGLLIFIYGIANDMVLELKPPKVVSAPKNRRPLRTDCLLIAPERRRTGKLTRSASTTNVHVIVEQAFQLLHTLLKKDRLKSVSAEHRSLLEPFIPVLTDCLTSKHSRLISAVLRCITSIVLKFPDISSFDTHSNRIKNNIFIILEKHCGMGLTQGENLELVVMCFKTISCLIRDINKTVVDEDQLRVLLSYVEQDMNDEAKKATAFTLLKAIISRKLNAPELEEVMRKVAEMSIQSEVDHIRTQCRQVWTKYLMDYPHGKRLKGHLIFFTRQLEYEHESGRESALLVLSSIVKSFPVSLLEANLAIIFIPLASRLINEDSSKCKRLVFDILKELLNRVNCAERDKLFVDVVIPWMEQSNIVQRRLSIQLSGIFAEVEGDQFSERFSLWLPLFIQQLDPERYAESTEDTRDKENDHFVYQMLSVFAKVLRNNANLIKTDRWAKDLNQVWHLIGSTYICYPHAWVRLISAQLFGLLFSSYSVQQIVDCILSPTSSGNEYLLRDTRKVLCSLCKQFTNTMQSVYDVDTLGEQLVKNLVFIAKVMIKLPENNDESSGGSKNELRIGWLMKRLLREVRSEVSISPNLIKKRLWAFKWMAAVILELDQRQLESYLEMLMTPLCRELSDKSNQKADESEERSNLMTLSQQVVDLIRSTVGNEVFNPIYATVRLGLNRKRTARKQQKALELINDPVKGIKLKQKKHLAKRVSKKRKLEQKKGRVRSSSAKKLRTSDNL